MLNPKGFSDLPTVTPTMAEDLDPQHLIEWIADYQDDLIKVVLLNNLLDLDRQDDILRLSDSLARLDAESTERRIRDMSPQVIAEANAILQGVES